MLDAAYQMMIQANPFLFDKANQMYAQGMTEQDTRSIRRSWIVKRTLVKSGYASDLDAHNASVQAATQAAWSQRSAAQKQALRYC